MLYSFYSQIILIRRSKIPILYSLRRLRVGRKLALHVESSDRRLRGERALAPFGEMLILNITNLIDGAPVLVMFPVVLFGQKHLILMEYIFFRSAFSFNTVLRLTF